MDIQEVLKKLEYNNDRVFPLEDITEVINNRDDAIPHLLGILEHSIENFDALFAENGYFAHIYAMYLLAQFREKKAYPLLIKLFSIPGDEILYFTGDVATEDLARIFFSVCHGDTDPLKSLIENNAVNEYVRSAALNCLLMMVAAGQKDRSEIVAYHKELFNGRLEREYSHVWDTLVTSSYYLYPGEVFGEIRRAYEAGLVDTFFIRFRMIEDAMNKGKEESLLELGRLKNQSIDDTITELKNWACFRQPDKKKGKNYLQEAKALKKEGKTGRNDPCPCGSGKKYKKCCLGKA